MTYDVAVIGGGLAGSSSAIHLARLGRKVLLIEKKQYPVHKLCGEFLSVEAQTLFRRVGVLGAVLAAGPRQITGALVSSPSGSIFRTGLPGTALGLSRFRLDPILLRAAVDAGVEVRQGEAVAGVQGALEEGFELELTDGTVRARTVIGAYGRRETLDRKLDRPFLERYEPAVAFKAHFTGLDLGPAVEMHAFPGGYCGLSHVEENRVNVCWIADEGALKAVGGDPDRMINTVLGSNPILAERLSRLSRVTDYSAVSQVTFAPKGKFDGDVCMVGDAAGMIAPVCGDGMAMALRSAEMAAPLISAYLCNEIDAETLKAAYEHRWRREFAFRMRLGRLAQRAFTNQYGARFWVAGFRTIPACADWFIRRTRGTADAGTAGPEISLT